MAVEAEGAARFIAGRGSAETWGDGADDGGRCATFIVGGGIDKNKHERRRAETTFKRTGRRRQSNGMRCDADKREV